jgi:YggT family protein
LPVVYTITLAVLRILEFMIFARAILSWFPAARESAISNFFYVATEPVIQPFRSLLSHIRALQAIPLDFSVLLAFLALEIIQAMLYSFL